MPNQNIMNNSYYTYNPTRGSEFNLDKDDSARYSYHLIENLKNAMNKIDNNNPD